MWTFEDKHICGFVWKSPAAKREKIFSTQSSNYELKTLLFWQNSELKTDFFPSLSADDFFLHTL